MRLSRFGPRAMRPAEVANDGRGSKLHGMILMLIKLGGGSSTCFVRARPPRHELCGRKG